MLSVNVTIPLEFFRVRIELVHLYEPYARETLCGEDKTHCSRVDWSQAVTCPQCKARMLALALEQVTPIVDRYLDGGFAFGLGILEAELAS